MLRGAIGIDLGTTYSRVGFWRDDQVEIIPNDHGKRKTPSCVSFSDHERLVGNAAKYRAKMDSRNTVFNVKRLVGREFSDPQVQSTIERSPFRIVNRDGRPYVKVQHCGQDREFSPEDISAMILAKLRDTAETYLKATITNAVIAVPPHFNGFQRQATKEAGTICGLNVLHTISESGAAAIPYALSNNTVGGRNVLILDLGGGTFDVTITTIEEGIVEVIATASDTFGGEDFDDRLVDYFVWVFKQKNGKDISCNLRALRRLRSACERAKRTLSFTTSTSIEVEYLFEGIDFSTSLTRNHFETLCEDLFPRILGPIEKALRYSKIDKDRIEDIVFIGGSSHIPHIVNLVSAFFGGKEPNRNIDPDLSVAHGAAVQAAILTGDLSEKTQNLLVLEVAPHPLGIETSGGVMTALINRNTTIPMKKSEIFTTCTDNQSSLAVLVYEGGRARTKDNTFIGSLNITGIHPAPRGVPQIEVTLDIDARNVLGVSAVDKTTGKSEYITITDWRGRLPKEVVTEISAAAIFRTRE